MASLQGVGEQSADQGTLPCVPTAPSTAWPMHVTHRAAGMASSTKSAQRSSLFPVPYCDIPILSVPDPLSLPSIHGTFNSQGGKNLLPQCFLVADAQSIGVNEVYSHSGHQPIPWTGALSLHTLTVTLKVMAFCRPSGEICSSSATVRISVALTTVAISWQSVCRTQGDGTGHSLCMHPESGQKS